MLVQVEHLHVVLAKHTAPRSSRPNRPVDMYKLPLCPLMYALCVCYCRLTSQFLEQSCYCSGPVIRRSSVRILTRGAVIAVVFLSLPLLNAATVYLNLCIVFRILILSRV
jgi:hypothetical protein